MLLHIASLPNYPRPVALRDHFELALAKIAFIESLLERAYDKLRMQFQHRDAVKIALSQELGAARQGLKIKEIFASIGIEPEKREDQIITGLTDELEEVCASTERNAVRDAVCIAVAQRIIHQKIAYYGTLRAFAITFKEEEVVEWLESCLDQEKSFDRQWTALSRTVNDEAANKEY